MSLGYVEKVIESNPVGKFDFDSKRVVGIAEEFLSFLDAGIQPVVFTADEIDEMSSDALEWIETAVKRGANIELGD